MTLDHVERNGEGTMMSGWYNFTTDEYEYRDAPTTDEQAMWCIPQDPSALALFQIYRKQDLPILESMIHVLTACVGEEE